MYTHKNINIELEIDQCYSESELIAFGMTALNDHGMDYYTFERNTKIYFFEKVDQHLFRLFCQTSRQSFYLS